MLRKNERKRTDGQLGEKNHMLIELNPTMLIITLNVNGLSQQLKVRDYKTG